MYDKNNYCSYPYTVLPGDLHTPHVHLLAAGGIHAEGQMVVPSHRYASYEDSFICFGRQAHGEGPGQNPHRHSCTVRWQPSELLRRYHRVRPDEETDRLCGEEKPEKDSGPLMEYGLYELPLLIDRENMRQGVKTIMQAAELAKNGTSIFIFPEGTRNKSGDETNLAPFHDGSFKVSQRGKVPIVPVTFNNSESIFEKHIPKIISSKVVVEFGDPVNWDDMDKATQKHVGEHFRGIILETLLKNQELTA